jgi:hypothetical protein
VGFSRDPSGFCTQKEKKLASGCKREWAVRGAVNLGPFSYICEHPRNNRKISGVCGPACRCRVAPHITASLDDRTRSSPSPPPRERRQPPWIRGAGEQAEDKGKEDGKKKGRRPPCPRGCVAGAVLPPPQEGLTGVGGTVAAEVFFSWKKKTTRR